MKIVLGDIYNFYFNPKLYNDKSSKTLIGRYKITGMLQLQYNKENMKAFILPKTGIVNGTILEYYIFVFIRGNDSLSLLHKYNQCIFIGSAFGLQKEDLYKIEHEKINISSF